MIVYLPIKLKSTGGTSSFAQKFQTGMASQGHTVEFTRPKEYDVLLVSPIAPILDLVHAYTRQKPIVHRLDGVYYPTTVAGKLYLLHNFKLWLISHIFATSIIYQSAYSKKTAEIFLGKNKNPHTIIHNGIDTTHFTPTGAVKPLRENPNQHVFIVTGRFRRIDQILPVIQAFQEYKKTIHADSRLYIIGNLTKNIQELCNQYKQNQTIEFLGVIPNQELPEYLRAADMFLFTHSNPPCPNNVLEAIACGLPVCGIADGAMPELIESGITGELLPVTDDAFYTPRTYDASQFAMNMKKIMATKESYSTAARKTAVTSFGLEQMIASYLKVLESL